MHLVISFVDNVEVVASAFVSICSSLELEETSVSMSIKIKISKIIFWNQEHQAETIFEEYDHLTFITISLADINISYYLLI